MKKTAKSLLAIILALVMALGTIPAFAYEIGGLIGWYFAEEDIGCDEGRLSNYGGILVEGKNSITFDVDKDSDVYEFTASEPGYYLFQGGPGSISIEMSKKTVDGAPVGYRESLYQLSTTPAKAIFYLEKETVFVLVNSTFAFENSSFDIEYLGDTITNVDYGDGDEFENLIIGVDIDEDRNDFERYFDTSFTFSGGKTITMRNCPVRCTLENKVVEGENKITVNFLGKTVDETVTAYPLDKYLKDITIDNRLKYTRIKMVGTNPHDFYPVYPDENEFGSSIDGVTVKFSDGIEERIILNHDSPTAVEFPNGHTYSIEYRYLSAYSDHVDSLNIYVNDTLVKSYECRNYYPLDYMFSIFLNHIVAYPRVIFEVIITSIKNLFA